MKIIATNINDNKVIFTIEYSDIEWTKQITTNVRRVAKNITIPGFRKGHAPLELLKGRINTQAVYKKPSNDAILKMIDFLSKQPEFENENIIDVTPSVAIVKMDEHHFVANLSYSLFQPLKLVGLDNLKKTSHKYEPNKFDFEFELYSLLANQPGVYELEEQDNKEYKTVCGDIINISHDGFINGKHVSGLKIDNINLFVGSRQNLPSLTEKLIDRKVGDVVKFDTVLFNDLKNIHLANKKINFVFKVNKIFKVLKNNFDQINYKSLNIDDVTNINELNDFVKEKVTFSTMRSEYEADARETIQQIIDANKIDNIPKSLIDLQKKVLINTTNFELSKINTNIDREIANKNIDRTDFEVAINDAATFNTKTALIVESLLETREIPITKTEISQYGRELLILSFHGNKKLAHQNFVKSVEEIQAAIRQRKLISILRK